MSNLEAFGMIITFALTIVGIRLINRGVNIIVSTYLPPKVGTKGSSPRADAVSIASIKTLVDSINTAIDRGISEEMLVSSETEDGDKPPAGDDPDANSPQLGSAYGGIAKIIEALPTLLNASFGPAVYVSLVGLGLAGGGILVLLELIKMAGS